MKIIFSRKGFDSGWPGYPSPIIEGRPRSLPIEGSEYAGVRYGDLWGGLGEIVTQLIPNFPATRFCHLDPDIDAAELPRDPGWRGAFGQVDKAQGHLANQGVAKGDLFLFFGLFQPVIHNATWQYHGRPEHRLFGYLQIDEIVPVGRDPTKTRETHTWLHRHPHLQPDAHPSSVVYIAAPSLEIDNTRFSAPGSGVFKSGLRLTAPDSNCVSRWRIWPWLDRSAGGVGMSFTPYPGKRKRWDESGHVTVANRGQEFVSDIGGRADAMQWLTQLFHELL